MTRNMRYRSTRSRDQFVRAKAIDKVNAHKQSAQLAHSHARETSGIIRVFVHSRSSPRWDSVEKVFLTYESCERSYTVHVQIPSSLFPASSWGKICRMPVFGKRTWRNFRTTLFRPHRLRLPEAAIIAGNKSVPFTLMYVARLDLYTRK